MELHCLTKRICPSSFRQDRHMKEDPFRGTFIWSWRRDLWSYCWCSIWRSTRRVRGRKWSVFQEEWTPRSAFPCRIPAFICSKLTRSSALTNFHVINCQFNLRHCRSLHPKFPQHFPQIIQPYRVQQCSAQVPPYLILGLSGNQASIMVPAWIWTFWVFLWTSVWPDRVYFLATLCFWASRCKNKNCRATGSAV